MLKDIREKVFQFKSLRFATGNSIALMGVIGWLIYIFVVFSFSQSVHVQNLKRFITPKSYPKMHILLNYFKVRMHPH